MGTHAQRLRQQGGRQGWDSAPWYTYPCIHFLAGQSFAGMRVLEFGAGQSTLWWAERAASVVAFEADVAWLRRVAEESPANTVLHALNEGAAEDCCAQVRKIVDPILGDGFDLVIVDGQHRYEFAKLGVGLLAPHGALICDNAEGYGIFDALRSSGLMRVDFYEWRQASSSRTALDILSPILHAIRQ
jgi:predicted O-methyltransferase YrrM